METEKIVKIPQTIVVKEFAERLEKPVTEVIAELMKNGIMATLNEEIDFETAAIICQDFDVKAEQEISAEAMTKETGVRKQLQESLETQDKSKLKRRPPVVVVLGHVDHGKTTLLDALRETNVAGGEAGSITQHIGAYQAKKKGRLITLLDTPGHEAFAAMRARGAKVTDIAILMVAADDGVQPQTREAVEHIKTAGVPMIVAINKIDKPGADVQRVKKALADIGVLTEDWGGDTVAVEISAKKKLNLDALLDMILLIADMQDLRADNEARSIGTVIEVNKSSQKGIEVSLLVQNGILHKGDAITIGKVYGTIRSMKDPQGHSVNQAKPGTPVLVTGLSAAPTAGDIFLQETSIREAKAKAGQLLGKNKKFRISGGDADVKLKKLNLIIKADVDGSLEAILESLDKIESDQVGIALVDTGIGKITESDVMTAASSGAQVIGFNVIISPVAKRLAESKKVPHQTFSIIYDLLDTVVAKLNLMIEPVVTYTALGEMTVKAIFYSLKGKMTVGGEVTRGMLKAHTELKILRSGTEVGMGKLVSLQMGKISVNDVPLHKECGLVFEGKTKIKEGDVLVCMEKQVEKKTVTLTKDIAHINVE